ncbi:MAG: MobQ family relaxase [Sinimarinibacterium sp.]|jgi:hypothetical protein
MAIYHFSVKPMSRSTGRSAPAAAAYRSGTALMCTRDKVVHDYRPRRGDVVHAEIVMPKGVTWVPSRDDLWNAAEGAEARKDARVAREVVIALPYELSPAERVELTLELAQLIADKFGVAVDVAVHRPGERGDQRNHHAHLMLTTRVIDGDGLGVKSLLEGRDKDLLKAGHPRVRDQITWLREDWARMTNRALVRAGVAARVDHRTLLAQGVDREPTMHRGVAASNMERSNKTTERGDQVLQIEARNEERRLLKSEIAKAHDDLRREERQRVIEIRRKLDISDQQRKLVNKAADTRIARLRRARVELQTRDQQLEAARKRRRLRTETEAAAIRLFIGVQVVRFQKVTTSMLQHSRRGRRPTPVEEVAQMREAAVARWHALTEPNPSTPIETAEPTCNERTAIPHGERFEPQGSRPRRGDDRGPRPRVG